MMKLSLSAESTLPRIAMVSTHGYVAANPPLGAADTGGQVVYVLELSKKLAQLGYEVDIWTRQFEDQPPMDVVNDRVRVIRVPCGGKAFIPKEYLHESLLEWGENTWKFIQSQGLKYDFINSHYWDGGLAGQGLAEALGIPHVHTPHSLGIWKKRQMETDFPEDKEKFERDFNFKARCHYEKVLYQACSLVVATTPVQTDMLLSDYEVARAKTKMIPPGYDDNRFYPVGQASREAIRQRLGFKGKVVLALGRLATNKGYDLLVQAFGILAEREPEAVLHLAVGGARMDSQEGRILGELKETVTRLGLENRVHFSGFIADEDLPDYYRAADLFVLSSRYEPFGMTAIESMACGTPTVVTTHGGLFRAVHFGVHALYADTFDNYDLGITMLKPLRHRAVWHRLSQNGAHRARSLFTWTGIAQQLIAAVAHQTRSGLAINDEVLDIGWNT